MSSNSEMTPDARMTAHIAEKVMGWTWSEGNPTLMLPGCWLDEHGGEHYPSPGRWRPLASISDAMEALEKIRRTGEWCCITLDSDYHYVWTVKMTRSELHGNEKHEPTVRVEHEDFPRAICEALCAATGYEPGETAG